MTRIGDTTTDVLGACAGAEGCTQPVVVVIVTEASVDRFQNWHKLGHRLVETITACAGHAPEVVHEARTSMDESEYVILEVPK